MLKKHSNLFIVLLLALIVSGIYLTNFRGDFWLTGWDNLHPEFNFKINLERAFFSSWQEYQGLGLPAGNGHASELIREVFLTVLSFVTPAMELRKIYTVLMLFLGSLGVFVLLKNLVLEKSEGGTKNLLSLAGSLFYLLSIATVQIFYMPYDPFTTFYAALPWLTYSSFVFVLNPNKKTYLFFIAIQFLSSPAFYLPTLFFSYILFLALLSFGLLIEKGGLRLRYILTALFTIFLLNSYWLLPFVYYTLTNSSSQINAYINLLYSQDIYLKNVSFGNLPSVSLLKGFLFDYTDLLNNQSYGFVMADWRTHFNSVFIKTIGCFFFLIILYGFIKSLLQKKNIYLVLPFFFFFSLLAIDVFPFSILNQVLRNLPLVNDVFRNPFTKFANILLFLYSIFFVIGLQHLLVFLKRKYAVFALAFLVVLIFLYTLPIWSGKLIYQQLKVKIPDEYFGVFDYFKDKGNTRIANLPQFAPDGWENYAWGYRGSGFIWYGINQPILDRAFDVWSSGSENYYWEISRAIYSKNENLIENVLKKYQINWIILDENIVNSSSPRSLYYSETEKLFNSSDKISLAKIFGKIRVYKVESGTPISNFVFQVNGLPNVTPAYKWSDYDRAFADNKNYYTANNNSSDVYYPFRSAFTGRTSQDLSFKIEDRGDYYLAYAPVPEEFTSYQPVLPSGDNQELPVVDPEDLGKVRYIQPEILQDEKGKLTVKIPKVTGYFSSVIDPTVAQRAKNCNQFMNGTVKNEIVGTMLRQTSFNAANCNTYFDLPNLPINLSYIVSMESKNILGSSLLFWVENKDSRRVDLRNYLPKSTSNKRNSYILPSLADDDIGFVLHFDNISIGDKSSVNDLGKITVNPFPLKYLNQIKYVRQNILNGQEEIPVANVLHPNTGFYKITPGSGSNFLILSQSFDYGWTAFDLTGSGLNSLSDNLLFFISPFIGRNINSHLLVNNWENGWRLNGGEQEIVLIYWPQYLEFLGFVIAVGFVLVVLKFNVPAGASQLTVVREGKTV